MWLNFLSVLHVLKQQGNAVVVDATDLGSELNKGINGLRSLLKYLSNPTNSLTEHSLTDPGDARWAIQSGATALNYTAGADSRTDVILGWNGDDTMNGGGGNDIMLGGEGKDTLDGGEGNDQLYGGAGDDTLTGGAGNDQLKGGADNDTYKFDAGWGKDVITDSDGKGSITIGDKTLGTAQGAGKTNVWVTELGAGSGQYVGMALYDDASSSTGKKLMITKDTDTSNTIVINNFDLSAAQGAGYLGIKLDKTQKIFITQGNGAGFTVSLAVGAKAGMNTHHAHACSAPAPALRTAAPASYCRSTKARHLSRETTKGVTAQIGRGRCAQRSRGGRVLECPGYCNLTAKTACSPIKNSASSYQKQSNQTLKHAGERA